MTDRTVFYKILKVFGLIVVVACTLLWVGKTAHESGVKEGIDKYHEVCYTVGGVVQNNNTYVYCQPVTLDNREVMLYNK
jgi:hypothetical protein